MHTPSEDELRDLRLKYQVALHAHETFLARLAEAASHGIPSEAIVAQEAKALRELVDARAQYRDALMLIAFGDGPPLS